MFPSLLQGVSLDRQGNTFEAESSDKDLYEYFTLLKSIKLLVEGGLVPLDDHLPPIAEQLKGQKGKEMADLEGDFYYHVSSLYRVLTQLTSTANAVTSKYNEIMGQINQSDNTLSW